MTTDASLGELYTKKVLELAQEYDLSAYDAAYLELAMRKRAILGTLDKNLRRASALAKIPAII
jgi:predicted nucleic acid-binding protein